MKPALPTILCLSLGLLVLPAAAVPAAAQMRVKVAAVVAAPLRQTLQLPGNLVAPRSSALTPQVEGHVAELLVEAGDRVEAGQPLLRLDDTVARLELERLQHALREAEHLHRDARRLAREAETLAGAQSVSRSKSQTQTAQAAIEEARVSQLRAAVAIQGERLRHHTLAAPFAGAVTGRQAERGQWVGTGGAVLRLTGTDPLRVDVAVPERHFGRIAAGTPVTVLAAEGSGGNRDGAGGIAASVERIVPAADPVSRSFLVHIGLPNPTGALMPGMSARVVFALDHGRDDAALQVPADAVVRKADGGARVWVVRSGGDGAPATARPVEVRTGRHAGGWVEIAAPDGGDFLRPDDLVVVQGNEGLRPGQPVVPETLG
ncbi:multidrug efflux system membrane fusion protein [Azospirillum agricola]|uniref:efflux RND transporter periplasmic adaptor subunit n=1 Tax=Azospirillum agricola TaxID=1720247 RepID=UPI001AE8442C|nr:efflux RND transporter periplasmic adaptor subunit [Azospirillum agricola]MBP2227785.1 multidrug efflux system membrane fusion protein [Azospirillum agricola]